MWLKSSTTIEKTQSNTKGNTPPEYPTIHQQWIDTSGEKPILKEWDGNAWIAVESDVTKLDPQFTNEVTEKLTEAHNNALEAIQDATEAIEKAEGVSDSVNAAVNEAKEAQDKAQEAMDNLVTFKEETTGKITEINGNFEGLQTTVTDQLEEQETQINQTSNLVNIVASNGVNLFPYGGMFENGVALDKYVTGGAITSSIEDNQWKNNINASNKCLVLRKNNSGDGWVNLKEELSIFTGRSNENFTIDCDYMKAMNDGTPEISLAFFDKDNKRIQKTSFKVTENTGSNWKHGHLDVTSPNNTVKVKIVIGITGISSKCTCYLDNIVIKRTEVTQTELNVTKEGLQAQFQSVDNKVGQVTASVNGLTTQFNNYKTDTDTRFNVVDGSINGMVKKGELISQFNMEAGKTLINSSKQIVLSSNNIIFDSANPVRIPGGLITGELSANLIKTGSLIGKQSEYNLSDGYFKVVNNDKYLRIEQSSIQFGNNDVDLWGIQMFDNYGLSIGSSDVGYSNLTLQKNFASLSYDFSKVILTSSKAGLSGLNGVTLSYGGDDSGSNILFNGTPQSIDISHQIKIIERTDGANRELLSDRSKTTIATSNEELGTTWKQVTIEGNKTLDIHKDYIDVAFGGLKRTIKKGSLPDGTSTMYIGTSDNKAGIHITGGNVYLELNGSTYAFDTKYLKKL